MPDLTQAHFTEHPCKAHRPVAQVHSLNLQTALDNAFETWNNNSCHG